MTGAAPRSLDEARQAMPHLGFALYAFEPGIVTLEILDGEETFTFTATTEAAAWTLAFPEPTPSVFD